MSLLTSIMSLAVPIGLAFAGPLADVVGISMWYFISGTVIVLLGIWSLIVAYKFEK